MDEKGYSSNAYWWRRIRNPDRLAPYLRIAAALGMDMPLAPDFSDYVDHQTEMQRRITPMFFEPYDRPANITKARNLIAEHLAVRNLSLCTYIANEDYSPPSRVGVSPKICRRKTLYGKYDDIYNDIYDDAHADMHENKPIELDLSYADIFGDLMTSSSYKRKNKGDALAAPSNKGG